MPVTHHCFRRHNRYVAQLLFACTTITRRQFFLSLSGKASAVNFRRRRVFPAHFRRRGAAVTRSVNRPVSRGFLRKWKRLHSRAYTLCYVNPDTNAESSFFRAAFVRGSLQRLFSNLLSPQSLVFPPCRFHPSAGDGGAILLSPLRCSYIFIVAHQGECPRARHRARSFRSVIRRKYRSWIFCIVFATIRHYLWTESLLHNCTRRRSPQIPFVKKILLVEFIFVACVRFLCAG